MSLPPDYVPWCQAHGLNAWHPDEWPPAARDAFQAWKRDHAAQRLARRVADGTWDLYSPERQAELLAEDAAYAEEPPPSRPYRRCPCHVFGGPGPATDTRLPEDRLTPAEVNAWVSADPLWRSGLQPKTAACLAWLEQTFGDRERAILAGRRPRRLSR